MHRHTISLTKVDNEVRQTYEWNWITNVFWLVLTQNLLEDRRLDNATLSATLAKSEPLAFPSEKSFLLFFAHEKGSGHMFQK